MELLTAAEPSISDHKGDEHLIVASTVTNGLGVTSITRKEDAPNSHIIQPHLDSDTSKCSLCHKTFKTLQHLMYHVLLHSKKFQCIVCGELFSLIENLTMHMRIHYGLRREKYSKDITLKKLFKCSLCEKSFAYPRKLTQHVTIHFKVAPNNNIKGETKDIKYMDSRICQEAAPEPVDLMADGKTKVPDGIQPMLESTKGLITSLQSDPSIDSASLLDSDQSQDSDMLQWLDSSQDSVIFSESESPHDIHDHRSEASHELVRVSDEGLVSSQEEAVVMYSEDPVIADTETEEGSEFPQVLIPASPRSSVISPSELVVYTQPDDPTDVKHMRWFEISDVTEFSTSPKKPPRSKCSREVEDAKRLDLLKFKKPSENFSTLRRTLCDVLKRKTGRDNDKIFNIKANGKIICKLCDRIFVHPGKFGKHLKLHMNLKTIFECFECNKKFTKPGYLLLHKRVHDISSR